MSIIDGNMLNNKLNSKNQNQNKNKMKSKTLYESIRLLLLLLNKTSRLASGFVKRHQSTTSANNKPNLIFEQISIKKLNMKVVFSCLIDSMSEMISHFLYLNNISLRFQQEQVIYQQDLQNTIKNNDSTFFTNHSPAVTKQAKGCKESFLTLKQTNEIVKQFYSVSNTLMILITSINEK